MKSETSKTGHHNWDDYRFFLATAESGSFSAAARILNVSQPTVSRRIAQMEQSLGLRLFDQHPEGYVLTQEGEALVDIANGLCDRAMELQRRAVSLQSTHMGTINLTTTAGVAQYWLTQHISEFHALYPKIQINIFARGEMLDLLRNEADIALRFGEPGSQELVGRRIGSVPFCLLASHEYLENYGRPKELSELRSHRFVGALGAAANFSQNLQLVSILEDDAYSSSTDNANVQLGLAQAGLGIVCLPCYMVQASGLEKILPHDFKHEIDLWLLSHKDIRNTPRVRTLLDFLYKNMKKELNGATD